MLEKLKKKNYKMVNSRFDHSKIIYNLKMIHCLKCQKLLMKCETAPCVKMCGGKKEKKFHIVKVLNIHEN
jgi:hypothetical protein